MQIEYKELVLLDSSINAASTPPARNNVISRTSMDVWVGAAGHRSTSLFIPTSSISNNRGASGVLVYYS